MNLNHVKLDRFKADINEALELGKSEDEALNIAIGIARIKGYDDEAVKQAVEYYQSPPPLADIPPNILLRNIIQYELPSIFRRQHLNRDVIYLPIGERGSGKSVLSTMTGILDYAVQGEPLWSNMEIKVSFYVPFETSSKYGLEAGTVSFESLPLDKDRFLDGDEEYSGGCAVIEEINIWLADARRAMSNQNLASADLVQMIRKLKTALIGNCIQEMFVDNRIRDAADLIILCEDMALFPEGLAAKKPQGEEFACKIYPMSRKLTGIRYEKFGVGQQPIDMTIKGRAWWGSFDTDKRQECVKYKPNAQSSVEMLTDGEQAPEVTRYVAKWSHLENRISNISAEMGNAGHPPQDGKYRINSFELWGLLGIEPKNVDHELAAALRAVGVTNTGIRDRKNGGYIWTIPADEGLVTV